MLGDLPLLLAAIFGFIAVRVAGRLYQRRRSVFDRNFTMEDRELAGAATFYWLVPLVVLTGALCAALLTRALGADVKSFAYAAYWAQVVPADDAGLPHFARAAIAATPGTFGLATAVGLMMWTRSRPHSAARNFVLLEAARILIGLTLVLQPMLSLLVSQGAFHTMRVQFNLTRPHLGDLVVLLYGVIAMVALWMWRSGHWRRRYMWLATPLFDQARRARERLADDARDTDARTQLARSFLGAGDTQRALDELDLALVDDPGHPRASYFAGLSALKLGQPLRAAQYLRNAGRRMTEEGTEDEELFYEVVLALSAARLALGDAQGALITVEEASHSWPREPRAMLLHADALIADGQPDRARQKLLLAQTWARGPIEREIRRRLASLSQ